MSARGGARDRPGYIGSLVVSGYLRTRREVALFDSDIRNDHTLIGTTLAVCVGSTWSSAGHEPALGLVEQANAARDYLNIRWIAQWVSDRRARHGPPSSLTGA